MVKRKLILTVCTLILGNLLFAGPNTNDDLFFKDFVSRNWNAESGLPGNTITDIMQDNDGYMYFGTYSGLLRFDGMEFISMNRLYEERYDFISARKIFQDSQYSIFWTKREALL